MDFDGQTALVTGSSRNIGRATAVALAELGANVGVTAKSNVDGAAETARLVEKAGGKSVATTADLADPDAIIDMVETVRDELGPIDVLINNATYRPTKPFLEIEPTDVDEVTNINFRGMLLTTQAVVPDMLEAGHGSIVNLIGAMVYLGRPGKAHAYGSKMAIEGLVRQLATELGPDGIRVNGLSPGLIDTDREMTPEWEATIERVVEATPLGRMGTVDEIADAACFLASDRASFMTGQIMHVNGGTYPIPNITPSR